jgi:hypothetical protein
MPLYENAVSRIVHRLQQIAEGRKPPAIVSGSLMPLQLAAINNARASRKNDRGEPSPFPPMQPEILLIGRHVYNSRVVKDGYTLAEVMVQIANALHERSEFIPTRKATLLQNKAGRANLYGEHVRDEAVLNVQPDIPGLNSSP